jgi:hypothetical protein
VKLDSRGFVRIPIEGRVILGLLLLLVFENHWFECCGFLAVCANSSFCTVDLSRREFLQEETDDKQVEEKVIPWLWSLKAQSSVAMACVHLEEN